MTVNTLPLNVPFSDLLNNSIAGIDPIPLDATLFICLQLITASTSAICSWEAKYGDIHTLPVEEIIQDINTQLAESLEGWAEFDGNPIPDIEKPVFEINEAGLLSLVDTQTDLTIVLNNYPQLEWVVKGYNLAYYLDGNRDPNPSPFTLESEYGDISSDNAINPITVSVSKPVNSPDWNETTGISFYTFDSTLIGTYLFSTPMDSLAVEMDQDLKAYGVRCEALDPKPNNGNNLRFKLTNTNLDQINALRVVLFGDDIIFGKNIGINEEGIQTLSYLNNYQNTQALMVFYHGIEVEEPEETGFNKFQNSDKESPHRVRLVPKSQDAEIIPKSGELDESIIDLGPLDGYGFCLASAPKEADICDGATDAATIAMVMRGGDINPTQQNFYVNDVLAPNGPPSTVNISQVALNDADWTSLGLNKSDYNIGMKLTIRNRATEQVKVRLEVLPTNQDSMKCLPLTSNAKARTDGGFEMCLAKAEDQPTSGINCVGAEPYLILCVFVNPNATIQPSAAGINVDGVDYQQFPEGMFELVNSLPLDLTNETIVQHFKDEGVVDDTWQLAIVQTVQNVTDVSHTVKVAIQPDDQDALKYLIYSTWGAEYYPNGGSGVCVGPGTPVIKPQPISCDGSTVGVYIKFPNPVNTYTGEEFWLTDENGQIIGDGKFNSLIDLVDNIHSKRSNSWGQTYSGAKDAYVASENGLLIISKDTYDGRVRINSTSGFIGQNIKFYQVSQAQSFKVIIQNEVLPEDIATFTAPSTTAFIDQTGPINLCLKATVLDTLIATPDTFVLEYTDNNNISIKVSNPYGILMYSGMLSYSFKNNTANARVTQQIINGYDYATYNIAVDSVGSADFVVTASSGAEVSVHIERKADINKSREVRIEQVEPNENGITDGIMSGEVGTYQYLTFKHIFTKWDDGSLPIEPNLVITNSNHDNVEVTVVQNKFIGNILDEVTGNAVAQYEGMLRVDFKGYGKSTVNITAVNTTGLALTPLTWEIESTDFSDNLVALLTNETTRSGDVVVSVVGGSGTIIWGDGTTTDFIADANTTQDYQHTYADATGLKLQIVSSNPIKYLKLNGIHSIARWLKVGVEQYALPTVLLVPSTEPIGTTDYTYMFATNTYFNAVINYWNTVGIEQFRGFLRFCSKFNQDIGQWNMSSAINIREMLQATGFKRSIDWDVSKVQDAGYFFADNTQRIWIYSWDWSSCTDMEYFCNLDPNYKVLVMEHFYVPLILSTPPGLTTSNNPSWGNTQKMTVATRFIMPGDRINEGHDMGGNYNVSVTPSVDGGNVIVQIDGKVRAAMTLLKSGWTGEVSVKLTDDGVIDYTGDVEVVVLFANASKSTMDGFRYPAYTVNVLEWINLNTNHVQLPPTIANVPPNLPTNLLSLNSIFENNLVINDPNVSLWNAANIWEANSFLRGAVNFNQDLSNWCVARLNNKPDQFALNTQLTEAMLPVWGTCPTYYQGFKVQFSDGTIVTYPYDEVPDDFITTVQTPEKWINGVMFKGGSVTKIGDRAFKDGRTDENKTLSIDGIPKTIKSIGVSAFENMLYGDVVFEEGGVETIDDRAFYSTNKNGSYLFNLPDSLVTIGSQSISASRIKLGKNVTTLKKDAFVNNYVYGSGSFALFITSNAPPVLDGVIPGQAVELNVPVGSMANYTSNANWSASYNGIYEKTIADETQYSWPPVRHPKY